MIGEWGENDDKTKWKLHCGKKWWDDTSIPEWFKIKHPNFEIYSFSYFKTK